MKVFNRVSAAGQPAAIEALQAEVLLLREENARLRLREAKIRAGLADPERLEAIVDEVDHALTARHGAPGHVGAGPTTEDHVDEIWQTLTNALIVRDALIETCEQMVSVATRLRERLSAMTLEFEPPPAATPAPHRPAGRWSRRRGQDA